MVHAFATLFFSVLFLLSLSLSLSLFLPSHHCQLSIWKVLSADETSGAKREDGPSVGQPAIFFFVPLWPDSTEHDTVFRVFREAQDIATYFNCHCSMCKSK
ncbi:hypothetical protein BC939DRAFT_444257 [Gamsiella multidivaricata]|uniref:uncharacterized protein n=1 Tax=Gamsiella multidivaricata TaxID=101098 RepID=UPI00222058DF|nr:uncharacterized protein BC939DRAFT_444257 [Gamsiella multidivaricata]KAI7827996.1 hypothetical protein BC939DRAFT_444257 [Gamsiella multidivaricata]